MPGGIRAEGLVKRYGEITALDGLDLEVPEGTVLGLLGPRRVAPPNGKQEPKPPPHERSRSSSAPGSNK